MKTNTTHEVLTGICSVCLGRFVVEDRNPVLHGYKRPGDGYIRGNCDGMQFPMYEISTEGCFWVRDGLLRTAARLRETAARLRAGKVSVITKVKHDWKARKDVFVKLTSASTSAELGQFYCYSWADLCESEAKAADRDAESLERHAATYQKMIDAWKPDLEFISEDRLNAEKQEVRDAKAAAARRRRLFKALKTVFFHVGVAINKHKKGWTHAEWDREQMYLKHNSKSSESYANVHRLAPFSKMYPNTKKRGK